MLGKYGERRGGVGSTAKGHGSFFVLIEANAVELRFEVGASGVGKIDFSEAGTDSEEFIKGLVALVVDETELGNITAAARVAGLLADYYSRDVLVLDAQMHQNDTLVGEMHFVEGDTLEARRCRALDVLTECIRPSDIEGNVLH
jgi:hypothetical protein